MSRVRRAAIATKSPDDEVAVPCLRLSLFSGKLRFQSKQDLPVNVSNTSTSWRLSSSSPTPSPMVARATKISPAFRKIEIRRLKRLNSVRLPSLDQVISPQPLGGCNLCSSFPVKLTTRAPLQSARS